jgi:hypothetical protein
LKFSQIDSSNYSRYKYITCSWEINNIPWDIVKLVREWTDDKIKLIDPTRILIERVNKGEYPAIYELNIHGIGHDNRCTWCKTFRSVLNTKCKEKLNCPIQYENHCKYY